MELHNFSSSEIVYDFIFTSFLSVRGISFMTALYCIQDVALPVSFQIIAKTEYYTDPEDGKEKRRCPVPENRYCREMIKQALTNQIQFRKNEFLRNYILTDVRSASAENMMFIRHETGKDSVMPVKTDRKVALSYEDRRHGRYVRAENDGTWNVIINRLSRMFLRKNRLQRLSARRKIIFLLISADTSGLKYSGFQVT
jgi:hypothetical protein